MTILVAMSLQLNAQFTDKNKTNKDKDGAGTLGEAVFNKTTFYTSRAEDIMQLTGYQKKLRGAIDSDAGLEAEAMKNEALIVMVDEIARSKKNLKELKSGNTKHLEEYQKEHAPNYPVNVTREKQILTNRINYEMQVYNLLKDKDLSKPTSDRDRYTALNYLNGFKRAMERNLRYESDAKTVKNPGGSGQGSGNPDGPAVITKKGAKESIETGDPRLQSWLSSKDQRKKDFQKHQSEFEKHADNQDDNMARRSYQALIQLMMDEVNSSNWLIGQVGRGNIKKGSYDTNSLAANVQKQQSILTKAQKIKVSTPESLKANKAQAIELISSFAGTLN